MKIIIYKENNLYIVGYLEGNVVKEWNEYKYRGDADDDLGKRQLAALVSKKSVEIIKHISLED